jgi:hypothetical protein
MRALKHFLPVFSAILFAGCASYHLGPVMDKDADKSVEILPFNNQTLQPRLGDALTQALRERLQTDGTYHLNTHGDADIVLTGIVKQYRRVSLGYADSDAVTPENFRVEMTVHVIARERSTGKSILDRDVKGHTLVHIGADLASAERQALPLIAQDVAGSVTELLTEGAW